MIRAAQRRPKREKRGTWRVVLFLLYAGPASADAGRVVVALPASPDAAMAEVATRVKAELTAASFEVITMTVAVDVSGRDAPEWTGRAMHPVATLTIARAGERPVVDLRIRDRRDQWVSRRLDLGPRNDVDWTSDLAIHTVELLRATLIETSDGAPPRRAAPANVDRSATVPDRATTAERHSLLEGRTIAIGGAMLNDGAGIGPAFAPTLRFSVGHANGLAGRLSIAGPAFGASFTGAKGTASVRQELASLDLVYAPSRATISPFVSAGVGAYHVYASGQPNDPRYAGDHGDAWSALIALGAGIAGRLGASTAIALDVHAFITEPGARIAIGTQSGDPAVGPLGRPSFLTSLTLQSNF